MLRILAFWAVKGHIIGTVLYNQMQYDAAKARMEAYVAP